MKKAGKSFLMFLLLLTAGGAGVYYGSDRVQTAVDEKKPKYIFVDPADMVLNANLPDTTTIAVFESDVYPTIYLKAGRDESWGFRHILARHTTQYFINFDNKNYTTMFDNDVTGSELINAIEDFYKHCVDVNVPDYNRRLGRNNVYLGWTEINDEKVKCLLVVNRDEETITTFYPFIEKEENSEEENNYFDYNENYYQDYDYYD